jgi:hypothetical protein
VIRAGRPKQPARRVRSPNQTFRFTALSGSGLSALGSQLCLDSFRLPYFSHNRKFLTVMIEMPNRESRVRPDEG